ncbi:zinc-ribbon domain-containing protein [Lutibacter sp.]|uniref:zinc ribbon domain-containing protein n=1 Tax=Lutibacter sp. TaxID=1925666 RepID=UPI0034A005D5
MAFCTQCGTEIIKGAKFCTGCGASISTLKEDIEPDKNKDAAYKDTMHKRVSKSLKDSLKSSVEEPRSAGTEAKKFVENEAKKIIEDGFSKTNNNAPKPTQEITNKATNKTTSKTSTKGQKWILFYIIINILLVLFNSGSDEITGVIIFSVIVGVIYFFRKKKEKPFNIIAKIVLVLQAILAFSYIIQLIQFVGADVLFIIVIICLVLLIIINVKLIVSGNKKS